MKDKRDSASGSNPKHEEENRSAINNTSNGVFKPSLIFKFQGKTLLQVLDGVQVPYISPSPDITDIYNANSSLRDRVSILNPKKPAPDTATPWLNPKASTPDPVISRVVTVPTVFAPTTITIPTIQLHDYFQRPDPEIPATLQRYRSELRSAFPPHAPIPDDVFYSGTCKVTYLNDSTEKIPYPDWCHITTTNYYDESEPLIEYYTPEEWNAFTLQEQCSVTLFLDDLKAKDTMKLKKKTKVKRPKQGLVYHANGQKYATLEDVIVPKQIHQSIRHNLSEIGHPTDHKTIQMVHAYEYHLASDHSFSTLHGVKNFDDPFDKIGKTIKRPNPDRFKGDKDEKYSKQYNTFESELQSEECCGITFTTTQGDFVCDQVTRLRNNEKIIERELKKHYKGCSVMWCMSPHKNGYLHAHLIVDRVISPGFQKHLKQIYMRTDPGLNTHSIDFVNNETPESVHRCFSYVYTNLLPKPTNEKEVFAKTVADAAIWNCTHSADYTGINKLYMSGPVAQKVKEMMRPDTKFNGTIYEKVTLTKASGNEEDLVDIAFDELPERRVNRLLHYMKEYCPQIMQLYIQRGITDPFEMVKLHWKAHYANSIEKRQVEKAAILDLKKTINQLNFFHQKMYSIHYKDAIYSGLTELKAMQKAYGRTFDTKFASLHKRWLDEWIPQYPRISLPDDYDPTIVSIDTPEVRVFVPKMVVSAIPA